MRAFKIAAALLALGCGSAFAQVPAIGPGASSGVSALLMPVFPETYGAAGNAATYFDGAVTSTFTGATATGTNTSPTAPAITTVNNNDLVVAVFATVASWSVVPSMPNTRQNLAPGSGSYSMYVGDQNITSAGSVGSVSGTTSSSSSWGAATIPLTAAAGSISYVGSTTYQSGSNTSPVVLTKPAGVASGDFLLVCVANYSGSAAAKTVLWMPAGFQEIDGFNNANNPNLSCWGKVATSNEPADYTITYNFESTSGNTAVLLDYRGVKGPEDISHTLTSATAGFTDAAINADICISGIYGPSASQQGCGTITAINSSTSVNVSFYLPISISGVQFAFGSDDTQAFTTMLTSAPCSTVGCEVSLGMKHYALTGPLSLPPNLAISFVGKGPGIPNTAPNYISGSVPLANSETGTGLQWLTQSLSKAAITIGGVLHVTNTAGSDSIKNVSIIGGVGVGYDGGGANGLSILNAQNVWIDNTYIYNFYGLGAYIDGMAASNIKDWIGGISINNSVIENNSLSGIQIGSSLAVQNISIVNILNTFITGNGGPAITAAGVNIQGLNIVGNTIAWDNTLQYSAIPTEFNVTGRIGGGVFEGNYIEVDGLYGSPGGIVVGNAPGLIGMRLGSNYFSNNGFSWPTYSASGTPLPTCGTSNNYINHYKATVTDATSCAIGSAYSSGGTSRCDEICDNNAWTATGTASY